MMELKTISRLPADVAEALAQHYRDLSEQLMQRARHAQAAQAERARLRARRLSYDRIWTTVERLRLRDVAYEVALVEAGRPLGLTPAEVHSAYEAAGRRRGEHARRLRDLKIARMAAGGQDYGTIADALGLHRKTVGKIVRALAAARAFEPERRSG